MGASKAMMPRHLRAWPFFAYGALAGLYAAAPRGTWSWFAYHPFSMMTSYVALGASAAIVKKMRGYDNTKLHGSMMTVATLLAGFGWYVIYSNKEALGRPHLTSWHSWVSVVALLGYGASCAVGLVGIHPDFGLRNTKTVRSAHKWASRVATATGWVACVMGFNKMHADEPVKQLLFAAPLAAAAYFVLL